MDAARLADGGVVLPRRGFTAESRRRRGRDVDIPWRRVAAAGTWIFRGDESRRRRGWDVETSPVETGSRLRYSVKEDATLAEVAKREGFAIREGAVAPEAAEKVAKALHTRLAIGECITFGYPLRSGWMRKSCPLPLDFNDDASAVLRDVSMVMKSAIEAAAGPDPQVCEYGSMFSFPGATAQNAHKDVTSNGAATLVVSVRPRLSTSRHRAAATPGHTATPGRMSRRRRSRRSAEPRAGSRREVVGARSAGPDRRTHRRYLNGVVEDAAPLQVWPKSHGRAEAAGPGVRLAPLAPGTAVIYDATLQHRGTENTSPNVRTSLFVTRGAVSVSPRRGNRG